MSLPRKNSSKADRSLLRHEMSVAGCPIAEVATEMRVQFGLRPREAWRHAHGWTLQESADRVNAAAARRRGDSVAADASLIGKWEKWPGPSSRRPSLAVLDILAEVYGCAIEQLLDMDDRRVLPEKDLRIVDLTSGPRPSARIHAPGHEPPGVDVIQVAAEESASWAVWAEATNVGDIAVEQLMADVRSLSVEYLTGDPTEIFARTCRLRDRVFALLEGRQAPRSSRHLYTAAGYLCALLAWMSSDFGQLRCAETQGRTAWLCTELAEDLELRAWVLSTRSKIAFWDGRLDDAARCARRGAAHHVGGTVGILLACQEADAWSQLGEPQEALAALGRAADQGGVEGADEVGGLFSCPEIRRANYATAVRMRIRDPHGALREADEALRTQPLHSYGTTAQLRIARAFAHLALGCADGAVDGVRPVLDLAPDQRLEPVVRRMREFATAMAESTCSTASSAVALKEEIDEWCVAAASQRPALSPGRARTDWMPGHEL